MIERSMSLNEAMHLEPLTELALRRYTLREVNGELTFDALGENAVKDVQFVVDLINFYTEPKAAQIGQFKQYSLGVIMDYLRRTHEFYSLRMLPRMEMAIQSIQQTFSDHPIVGILDHFYKNYQNELLEHIELEENRLFPYAEELYDGKFSSDYSIKEFVRHHNHNIEDHLQDVLKLIEEDYPEVSRSFAYRSFKLLLNQFKADLKIHHLIEESIFLPKVLMLECS
ncbi:MAG: hypothetical protein HQ500_09255 [Flavobacteriales bacterium]|nr:hypothetical protein [Flavobacteriales bacterium]